MIGNNKIVLNQLTMQEAVQFWLDSKSVKPLSRVGFISTNQDGFVVNLVGEDAK